MTFTFHRTLIVFLFFTTSIFARSSTPLELASAASRHATLKPSSNTQGPLIVLDAGHGGTDEGAKVRQLQEKKITLLTALYAKKKLEGLGYRVLLTRIKDTYISLPKRVSIANQTNSALFVSIHCNAAQNHLAQGLEIYYCKAGDSVKSLSSLALADSILNQIIHETGCASRGIKLGRFHVIRETTMPAILIEIGFLTNYDEWASMRKKSYLEQMAKGIALGVDAYVRSKKSVLGAS
ncbi:MAG: N-acetylmuramoyl-L-alanine amidase [Chlamydiota bacterium]